MPEASRNAAPELYVIAGPNGAGKTTFAREFLPRFAKCREFVNADLIAGGLSPFSPATVAVEAGRGYLALMRRLHRRAIEYTSCSYGCPAPIWRCSASQTAFTEADTRCPNSMSGGGFPAA